MSINNVVSIRRMIRGMDGVLHIYLQGCVFGCEEQMYRCENKQSCNPGFKATISDLSELSQSIVLYPDRRAHVDFFKQYAKLCSARISVVFPDYVDQKIR